MRVGKRALTVALAVIAAAVAACTAVIIVGNRVAASDAQRAFALQFADDAGRLSEYLSLRRHALLGVANALSVYTSASSVGLPSPDQAFAKVITALCCFLRSWLALECLTPVLCPNL
jgi:hypothetical protein